MKVLFICTGNTCRSIMAEAIFNHLAPADWTAQSAGSDPGGTVNPSALAMLKRHGIPTQGLTSKSWDDRPTAPDIVITLCSDAAAEPCPVYLGRAVRAHWGMDDPSRVTGPENRRVAAFEAAFDLLDKRIGKLLALAPAAARMNDEELGHELERIGQSA